MSLLAAEPALGPATLDVSFRISAPKAAPAGQLALPDLLDVVNAPYKYVPVNLLFGSFTYGSVVTEGRPC